MSDMMRDLQQLESNESWLRGFDTPRPSASALQRTKEAMRQESARGAARSRLIPGAAAGFWAAAAMLAICVGLVWQAGPARFDQAPTALSAALALGSDPDESVLSALASEASELSNSSTGGRQSALEYLLDDVQDLNADTSQFWDS